MQNTIDLVGENHKENGSNLSNRKIIEILPNLSWFYIVRVGKP